MRFGHAGSRWAQARNAGQCTWSANYNQQMKSGFRTGMFAAMNAIGADAADGLGAVGGARAFGSMPKASDVTEYVPFAQKLPAGFSVSVNQN